MSRNQKFVWRLPAFALAGVIALAVWQFGVAQPPDQPPKAPDKAVVPSDDFAAVMKKMKAEKPDIAKKHMALLAERYDLADRAGDAKMTRGKAVQQGPRTKLPDGTDVGRTRRMTPARDSREGACSPAGFLPLPHPNHPEGGMLFPKFHIDEIKKQEGRDLTRFDLDFDLPDHFLPEFPPPMFLTTRPDLGDVSKGKLVTIDNFQTLFKDALNPKQLEGLRLLVTPFPQQQFNATDDRRSETASHGVTCFDCHVNGHTNAATHLVGDIRPQEYPTPHRHAVASRGERAAAVRLAAGAEDRRGLHRVRATGRVLRRRHRAGRAARGRTCWSAAARFTSWASSRALLDFPPAPKLDIFGKLDPAKASESEKRGEALFIGKAKCATCHPAPYYTDNTMHNLKTERFFKPEHGPRPHREHGRADQDVPAARHQGQPAVPARRPAADAGRRGRVLQPRAGDEADRGGEEGFGRVPEVPVAGIRVGTGIRSLSSPLQGEDTSSP